MIYPHGKEQLFSAPAPGIFVFEAPPKVSDEYPSDPNFRRILDWILQEQEQSRLALFKIFYIQSQALTSVFLRMMDQMKEKQLTFFALQKGVSVDYLFQQESILRPFDELFAVTHAPKEGPFKSSKHPESVD